MNTIPRVGQKVQCNGRSIAKGDDMTIGVHGDVVGVEKAPKVVNTIAAVYTHTRRGFPVVRLDNGDVWAVRSYVDGDVMWQTVV